VPRHPKSKIRAVAFSITLLGACALLAGQDVSAATGENPEVGREIYLRACASCHKGGFGRFFTGAPKTGKRSVWKPLLENGVDALVLSTLEGVGKMEPRGGCADCSDWEIRAAVEYMVKQIR
jgi:cytochrome c5